MVQGAPSANVLWTVGLFAFVYIVVIARETAHRRLDLYDLLMLSTVAVVPVFFAFFPQLAGGLSTMLGVTLPVIVMFAVMIVALFLFVNRLSVHMHRVRSENDLLVQELGLLQLEIDKLRKGAQ